MRLIDADQLIKTYEKETGYKWNEKCILECPKCFIDNAPTVAEDYNTGYQDGLEDGLNDIRPQGKWIWQTEFDGFLHSKCSNCNQFNDWGDVPFCPWCGTKMKGGAE